MKLAIIGSRNLPKHIDIGYLNYIIYDLGLEQVTHVVSGGAKGADLLGELWAKYFCIETIIFKPDWSIGRHAGMLRNTQIIETADIVLALWDLQSKGTKDSIKKAKKLNKKVYIVDINTGLILDDKYLTL